MTIYALHLADGSSNASASGMTNVANATKLGFTCRLKGDRLTTPNSTLEYVILSAAAGYLNLFAVQSSSGVVKLGVQSAIEAGTPIHHTSGVAQASLDANAYYEIRCYWDTTQGTQQSIELYDDTGTLLDSGSANVNTAISNGTFGLAEVNGGGGGTPYPGGVTIDWWAIWNGAPPSGWPGTTKPSTGAAGILRVWGFDDGTGTTAVEDVDNSTGQMSISGTSDWVPLSSAADHGIVTLTPSSVLMGDTALATVVWYDINNVPLTPQPSTTWSVNTDSRAATIDAGGNITTVGAGSATIKAANGPKTATADLTVRPMITFTEQVSVA